MFLSVKANYQKLYKQKLHFEIISLFFPPSAHNTDRKTHNGNVDIVAHGAGFVNRKNEQMFILFAFSCFERIFIEKHLFLW